MGMMGLCSCDRVSKTPRTPEVGLLYKTLQAPVYSTLLTLGPCVVGGKIEPKKQGKKSIWRNCRVKIHSESKMFQTRVLSPNSGTRSAHLRAALDTLSSNWQPFDTAQYRHLQLPHTPHCNRCFNSSNILAKKFKFCYLYIHHCSIIML